MAQLFILLLVLWPWGTLPIPHSMPEWYWRELGHFAVNAQLVDESEAEWRAEDARMQPACGIPEPGWQRERRTSDARKQLAWVRYWLRTSRDWPSVYDTRRFPPKAMVQGCVAFNNAYLRHLEGLLDEDDKQISKLGALWSATQNAVYGLRVMELRRHHRLVWQKRDEAGRCGAPWRDMTGILDGDVDLLLRRRYLRELRALVGPRAYYWGDWPGCVPEKMQIEEPKK